MIKKYAKTICILVALSLVSGCDSVVSYLFPMPDIPEIAQPTPTPTPPVRPALPDSLASDGLFGLPWTAVTSIDPYAPRDRISGEALRLIYEPLFTLDENFEARPVLCESWDVRDYGYTWTFTLKQNIKCHDDLPLTASDVVYSIERARAPSSIYSARLGKVKTIEASEDERTITLTLSEPVGRTPALLDIPIIHRSPPPEEPPDDPDIEDGDEEPPPLTVDAPSGTGPYTIRYDVMNMQFYLFAFSGWHQGKQPIQRIELVLVETPEDLSDRFQSQIIDIVNADMTGTGSVAYRGEFESWGYPTSNMQFLGFNTLRAPLDDPDVRRAIAALIDRERIVSEGMDGYADEAVLPAPPDSAFYDSSLASQYGFDRARAERFLEAAGIIFADDEDDVRSYAVGNRREPFTFNIIVNVGNTARVRACALIADTLRECGIDARVTALKWETYLAALVLGEFDAYYGETRLSADYSMCPFAATNPAQFAEPFPSGSPFASQTPYAIDDTLSLNYTGYSDEYMDKLVAEFGHTGSPQDASRLYIKLCEDAPFAVVLFKRNTVFARRGIIRGILPVDGNLFYNFAAWTVAQ